MTELHVPSPREYCPDLISLGFASCYKSVLYPIFICNQVKTKLITQLSFFNGKFMEFSLQFERFVGNDFH